MAALRQKDITVTSVANADTPMTPDERAQWPAGHPAAGAGDWRSALVRLVIGISLPIGGFILLNIASGAWIDCVRAPSSATSQCRVEKRMAGFSLYSTETLQIAAKAASEENTTGGYNRRTGYTSATRTRVVITGPYGNVATEWMAHPLPSSPWVAARLTRFLERGDQPAFKSRQIESAPVGAAVLFAILGAWFLVSALWRLVSRE